MKFYFIILLTPLFMLSCTQPPDKETKKIKKDNNSVIASVNGIVIYKRDIEGKKPQDVIDSFLLYNEAVKNGADKEIEKEYKKHEENILSNSTDKKTLEYLEDYRKKLITNYFKYQMLVNDEEINENTIKQFYEDNITDYQSITVDEVIFTDKKLAEEFLEKAKSGNKIGVLKEDYKKRDDINIDFYIITDPIYKKELKVTESGVVYDDILAKNGQFRVLWIKEINTIPYSSLKKNLKGKVRTNIGDFKADELVKKLRKNAEIISYSDDMKSQKSPRISKNRFLELTRNCENLPNSYAKTTCYKPFFQSVVFTNSGSYALSLSKELELDGVIKDCHLFAHHIGASLLEKHNFDVKKAFNSCSKECIQGCYHGVLEDYISTSNWNPEEVSTRGLELCKSITDDKLLLRQCVHGLGHGLIARKFTALINAVDICKNIESPNHQHACLGGVYMEYMDVFLPLSENELIQLVPKVCDETDSLNNFELSSKCYHAVGQGFMFYSGNDVKKSRELCKNVKKEFIEECTKAAEFMASGHHSH